MAVYRIVFQPLQQASVLVLLIAAFGVHMVLLGLGLFFFGPEGFQTLPLRDQTFEVGGLRLKAGDLIVLAAAALLMLALAGLFTRTMAGKALRASAVNRIGASLVGIATARTGVIAFALAAAVGAVSGILIGPVTTVYYDTGFMIGLKGLVAAVLGGLVSFPATVLAALLLAVFESACAFWASGYKEVLVFLLLLPVLLWRSFAAPHEHDDEE
jgi:branched-chain amino acid transport system permease protein